MATSQSRQRKRILCLDGGGTRGLSTILILKRLMRHYNKSNEGADEKYPFEVFDMICGTSTGGIIAIMLGRLQMTLDECEDAYLRLAERIFSPKRSPVNPLRGLDFFQANGKFDGKALEDAIRSELKRHAESRRSSVVLGEQAGIRIAQATKPQPEGTKKFGIRRLLKSKSGSAGLQAQEPADEDENILLLAPEIRCKVFVCTVSEESAQPLALRTYNSDSNMDSIHKICKVWEAVRATSAATTFFDPVKIGKYGETFVDGGIKENNPITRAEVEARILWPEQELVITSIGTGTARTESFKGNLITIAQRLKDMATDCDGKWESFAAANKDMRNEGRLFRFTAAGLEDVALDDVFQKNVIAARTNRYLENVSTKEELESFTKALLRQEDLAGKSPQAGTSTDTGINSTTTTDISQEESAIESKSPPPVENPASAASNMPESGGTSNNQAIHSAGSSTGFGIGSNSGIANVNGGTIHFNGSDQLQEKKKKCHQLLRTSNYESHKERNPDPVAGTCQWFLKHPNYVHWRDSPSSSLLWVSAGPGCGKSVLSKFLADKQFQANKDRTTCYFFFKDDNEDQKSTANALSAVLHQIFGFKNELLDHALKAYDRNEDQFRQNVDVLWNILIEVSADPQAGEIICILDALDECKRSELEYLLRKVCAFYQSRSHVSDKTLLKFLVTSRPKQYIGDELSDLIKELPTIHLAGEEDSNTDQIKHEIDLVIEYELKKIQHKWNPGQKILDSLREELTKFEHRTYLWLKLIFDLIRKDLQSVMKSGREKIFRKIPDSVDAAYTAILNQSTDKEQARKLLHIVCIAVRPLSVREMSIAMLIREDDKSLEDLEIPPDEYSKKLITNLCALFVTVIDERVYLLHQTAKEFLLGESELAQPATTADWIWKHSFSSKDSHLLLAHICMWYLRLSRFGDPSLYINIYNPNYYTNEQLDELSNIYDFLQYASLHWTGHFRDAMVPIDHPSIALALEIYNSQERKHATWIQLYWRNLHKDYDVPPGMNNLHLASLFGHQGVIGQLVPVSETSINIADSDYWTPLHCAANKGYPTIVSQLLAVPGIDVNIADNDGRTALILATMKGYSDVISQLLAALEIDINIADSDGWTALIYAATKGHSDIVSQLLAAPGIDINITDSDGWTAFIHAIQYGYYGIVSRLLAAPGIDINIANNYGYTALIYAAKFRHSNIISQLLAVPGIEINTVDKNGYTALSWAVIERHSNIVSQLLAAPGIDINIANNYGYTALSWAVKERHSDIISQLLAAPGIDIHAGHIRGLLRNARRRGHKDIIKLFENVEFSVSEFESEFESESDSESS